ncbi:hypothetical protein G9Q38_10530 [Pusillimonas sp. DMV24BSW_D]|uniref:hypothetical protein n=1 Tax=Neopusillimonas aestuarii TaxID=2716226 RepID=UPI00140A90A1|nr:hypothetical protein [Pusillimonas sp. DMV24BSW_D]QIM49579.1 hypothetical protein G9Q38_10530 [Pusillimonas sp. DMV24BSW_D]
MAYLKRNIGALSDMTVHIYPHHRQKNPEDLIREVSDLRTLQCFAHILNSAANHPVISALAANERNTLKSALIDHLVTTYPDLESRWGAVNWLISEGNRNIIPNERFDWLNENQDACSAIWGYLSTTANYFLFGQETQEPWIDQRQLILYHQLRLNPTPSSHAERFACIKLYFDTWIIGPNSTYSKSLFMDNIKNRWVSMLSEVKTLNWLNKPEREQCEWAWNYLEDYHRKENSDFRPGIPVLFSFHPINDHEKFLAIYGVLRNWTAHKAEKTLLLKNMSRAWRERQRRQDQKEKKAINSYVDVKVKERLALLARYNRCQINEVLSDLINKEYRRLESEIREKFD